MKKILLSSLILFASMSAVAGPLTSWTLRREGRSESYPARVPCTVAGALNEAGFFGPDVLEQDRYKSIDKQIFDDAWVFTTCFKAPRGQHHVLRFEGLNFYADIEINGHLIASSDTTFGTYCVREFDITPYAKADNTLSVTLRRAQKGDLNAGYVDWNPRPVDESMGIIRPVTLISTPDVQVQDVYVKPLVNPADLSQAQFEVNIVLVNRSNKKVSGTLTGSYESGSFSCPVTLSPSETRCIRLVETVAQPRIWWTAELGKAELYHLEVAFLKGNKRSHNKNITFGLRSIESEIDARGHRQFILNGKKVLVKSAGWTDDIFMQDTPESMAAQLKMVSDMGLNSVRFENIWGKESTVYDLCDELGLMALVGFSCQWEWEEYCGLPETKGYGCINDPASEALAVRYFHDQVIWLRNHPSVIGWLTGSDRIPNKRLEKQYLALYEELDYRPYVCSAKGLSSLAGPSGMKMEGPYEWVGPDYWWTDTKNGGAYGFNTETGPGLNIPQLENLRRIVGEKDLWPIGPDWGYHCTASSSHMNSTAFQEKVMAGVYGEATDLQDYMRKAHALDYDSERSMYEAFRGNVPTSTGIVQWMLNSAWPSLYWQLYDWYGVPTAGYYGTKVACRPVQLVYDYADGSVWAVNETIPEAIVEATLKVYDVNSKLIRESKREITSCAYEPVKVFDKIQGPCFVALELDGAYKAHNFYAVPAQNNVYGRDNWWGSEIAQYADLRFVSALPQATVRYTTGEEGITLTNTSDVIAYQNILKAKDQEGKLIPGALWSDNFFSLAPGESRTVTCILPQGVTFVNIGLDGWNTKFEKQ